MNVPIIRKTCLLLLAAIPGSVFCGPARAQSVSRSDTLVVRRDSISIVRGLLFPGADTVAISLALDSLMAPDEPAVPAEEILRPLSQERVSVEAAVPRMTAAPFVSEGDSLHRRYDFAAALEQYRRASRMPDADLPALLRRMQVSQNGLNLSESASAPTVIARQRFSLKDFYLFYPMQPGGWHPAPNVLDKSPSSPVGATYAPRNAKTVYFSATDEDGFRHLYLTENRDTAWTQPSLVDEHLLSGGNEIYPVLSADGNRLYFASDAFYGVGGYDLYVSERDSRTGRWGEPVNLGFPYSSPADDFLLMDTPDGKYTLFASNRECRSDSVYVYVLEQQKDPSRSPAHGAEDLRRLASLRPMASATRIDAGSAFAAGIPDDDTTRRYQERSSEVSRLRDSVTVLERTCEILRTQLAASAAESQAEASALTGMAVAIARQEEALSTVRATLEEATAALRDVEKDFLRSGVRSRTRRAAEREVVGAGSAYVFAKNALGPALKMKFTAPAVSVPSGDTFRVAPVGRFAPTGVLPGGVVFQIYLFSSPRHASLDDINGLAPVYERLTTSLKYAYAAGVFYSYSAALAALPVVRRLGFADAAIIAFRDNVPISVEEARKEETSR